MFAATSESDKISVLMVEDSRSEARLIHRLLHNIDHEFSVSLVSRLDEAIIELARHKIDVLILDLGLPDANGPESIQILRKLYPDLPIVVISGCTDITIVQHALEYGAQEFVSKNECSGNLIRQALLGAIIRKSLQAA